MPVYDKGTRDRSRGLVEKRALEEEKRDEFRLYLNKKLKKEVEDFLVSGDVNELVDLVEVVYSILESRGIGLSEFEDLRAKRIPEE